MNRPDLNKMNIHQVYAPVGAPGGANTNVQFNDGGDFGGDAALVFNKTTGKETHIGVKQLGNVVAPGEGVADATLIFSKDVNDVAGKAGLHAYFEHTGPLIVGAVVIKANTGDPAAGNSSEGLFCINTFDSTFKVYAGGAWRLLFDFS